MADNEEGEEGASRGNGWEVVQLTESTYAAAPGPGPGEVGDVYGEQHALFMSGHFVFPPSQHENLPLEPDRSEIHNENVEKDVEAADEIGVEERGKASGKDEETLNFQGLNVPDEFPGLPYIEEKDDTLLIGSTQFDDGTALDEQTIYSASRYSFDDETALGGSAPYADAESTAIPGHIEPSERGGDSSEDISQPPRSQKEDKFDVSDLPCGVWWKRRAASLYSHAKEANAFWSIFIAAAVMGLALIGQQWQHERWQALHQKWQLSVDDQKSGRMFAPISRLKDVIVGGHRRGSFISGSS